MRKRRFLFVFNRFFPAMSGAEVHIHQIIDTLMKRGHACDVFTLNVMENEDYIRQKGPLKSNETMGTLNIRRFPVTVLPLHNRLMHFFEMRRIYPYITGYRRVFSLSMINALRHVEYDCIVTGVMPFAGIMYPALQAARKRGIPCAGVPLIHLGVPHDDRYRYEYFSRQCVSLYSDFDMIIVNTEREVEFLRENGVRLPALRINPIISAYAQRKRDDSRFNICTLGFGNYEKGIEGALNGFLAFAKQRDDVKLRVGGNIVTQYRKGLSRMKNVEMLGMLNSEEKKMFFSSCDVYLQPSMAESFGIATIEAHSAGIPSINAYCSGSMEIVRDGIDGYLVPFGDTGMIARYLERFYNNRDLIDSMGKNAMSNAREYGYDNHIRGVEALEELVQ